MWEVHVQGARLIYIPGFSRAVFVVYLLFMAQISS